MVSNVKMHEVFIESIRESFNYSGDLIIREVEKEGENITIMFIDTLIDEIKLKSYVLEPLSERPKGPWKNIILAKNVLETESLQIAVEGMLKGNCALITDQSTSIFLLDVASTTSRPISESITEQAMKGAHDGFVESIILNIYQIRKRIESSQLTVKYKVKGEYSKSKIAIMYMNDLVNKDMLKEVERRIAHISVDYLQNPGTVIESLEDSSFSPFPQMLHTERPDRVAANLMDGKIVLVLDGSPVVLVVPSTFESFYQTAEDYNSRWYFSSLIRLIRYAGFFVTLTLPGFYIALVTFHIDLIPTELIFSMQASINAVPLPPIAEALLMQLTIELIREVSVRLPKAIASTVGLVGAILIGQAVVAAGLLSNIIIIIVALTALTSFVSPSTEMSNTSRLLSFPLMILAYMLGLLGLTVGLFVIIFHLCTLRSFGAPYFATLAPLRPKELADSVVRVPFWKMNRRELMVKSSKKIKEYGSRSWQHDKE